MPLRRNRGFRLLWTGQVLSDTGSQAALIAYPLLILALTHSAAIAGAVGTVTLLVQLVIGLPGGALSDRLDRRRTMIGCDAVRAIALAALGALVLMHLVSWPVVLVVAIVDRGLGVLFDPAATAALPGIVADGQLEEAWAATEARSYAANLAGPALGGANCPAKMAVYSLTGRASSPFHAETSTCLVIMSLGAGKNFGPYDTRTKDWERQDVGAQVYRGTLNLRKRGGRSMTQAELNRRGFSRCGSDAERLGTDRRGYFDSVVRVLCAGDKVEIQSSEFLISSPARK